MEVKKQVEEERKRKSADESSADESNAHEANIPAGSRASNDPDVTSPKKFKDEASNAPAKSKEVSKMPRPARKSSRNAPKSENGQEGELVKERSRSPTPESERLRERTRSGSSSSSRSPTPEKPSRSRRGRQPRGRATKRGGSRRRGQYATKESRSSSSSSQEEVTPQKKQHRRTNSISSRSRSKSPPAVSPEVTVTSRRSSRRVNVARRTTDEEIPDDGGGAKVKKGEIDESFEDNPKLPDDIVGIKVKSGEINKSLIESPKLPDDREGVKSEENKKRFEDNPKLPDEGGVKIKLGEINETLEDNPKLPDDGEGVKIKSGEINKSLEDNLSKKSEIDISSTDMVHDEIPVNQALTEKQSPCKTSPIQEADANQRIVERAHSTENKKSSEFIQDSKTESAGDVKMVSTKETEDAKLQPDADTKLTPVGHEKELSNSEKTVAMKVEEKSTSRLSRWKSSKSKAPPAEKSDALLNSEPVPDSSFEDNLNVSDKEKTTLLNVDISMQPVEITSNIVREQTKNEQDSESNLDSIAKSSQSLSQSTNDKAIVDEIKETHSQKKQFPSVKSKRKDSRSSDSSSSGSNSRSKSPKHKRSRSQSSSSSSSSRSRSTSSSSSTDRSSGATKDVTSHVKNKDRITQESTLYSGLKSEQMKDKISLIEDVCNKTDDEDKDDPTINQSSAQRSCQNAPRLRVSPNRNQGEREKKPDVSEFKKGIDLETPRGDAGTGKEMDIDNGSKESQQNEPDPDTKLKREKSAKKRKWGSKTSKATKATKKSSSLEISSDSLKNLIGDVKLTETVFDMEMEVVNTLDYDEHEEDRRDVKVKRIIVQSPQPDQKIEEPALQEDDRKVETRDEAPHEEPLSPAEPEKKIIKLSAAAPKEGGKKKSKEGKKGKKKKEEMAIDKESEDAKSTDKENKVFATTRTSKPLLPTVDEPEPVKGKQSPARNPTDRVIRIAGLVRPFTVGQLKELLRRSGDLDDNYFWINDIKSHCLAAYKTEEDAVKARAALHGTRWPQSNPKILIVDFATVEDVNHRKAEGDVPLPALAKKSQEDFKKLREQKEEEEKDKRQKLREQRDKEKEEKENNVREKRDEKDRTRRREPEKKNPVREWDRDKVQQLSKSRSRSKERERPVRRSRSRSREREQLKRRDQSRDKKEEERRKEKKQKETKSEEEPPAKLLDDLFRKTKAVPCIYWLPLTEERSVQRAAKKLEMEKERQKRIAAAEEREKEEQKRREAARLERQRERERGRERSREREREKTRQERSRSSRSDSRSKSRRRR
ncbi:unnamed protein product [Lymnaea stagnalis]|uniref:Apoptotic chromatin condensation inducer in the nucleus n=1 Tax=Lymnaea stagnalis TaxID=6523 RepID=A0AAV2IF29_LYMST